MSISDNISIKLCCACLSTDRKLISVSKINYVQMWLGIAFTAEDVMCWECTAMVKKFIKFRNQVKIAKRALEWSSRYKPLTNITGLSNLKTTIQEIQIPMLYIDKEEPPDYTEFDDYTEYIPILETNTKDTEYADTEFNYPSIAFSEPNIKDTEFSENQIKIVKIESFHNKFQPTTKKERTIKSSKYDIKIMNEDQMRNTREMDKLTSWYVGCDNKCESCIVGYKSKEGYREHYKKKHCEDVGKYICDICESRFSSKNLLANHCRRHYFLYKCKICGWAHHRTKYVLLHYSRDHENKIYICEICGKEFRQMRSRRHHIETKHKEKDAMNVAE